MSGAGAGGKPGAKKETGLALKFKKVRAWLYA